jgi:hypothetical protein
MTLICNYYNYYKALSVSRDSDGYGLDNQGVGVSDLVGARIFSPLCPSDRLWGPPSILSNRYGGYFRGGKAVGA